MRATTSPKSAMLPGTATTLFAYSLAWAEEVATAMGFYPHQRFDAVRVAAMVSHLYEVPSDLWQIQSLSIAVPICNYFFNSEGKVNRKASAVLRWYQKQKKAIRILETDVIIQPELLGRGIGPARVTNLSRVIQASTLSEALEFIEKVGEEAAPKEVGEQTVIGSSTVAPIRTPVPTFSADVAIAGPSGITSATETRVPATAEQIVSILGGKKHPNERAVQSAVDSGARDESNSYELCSCPIVQGLDNLSLLKRLFYPQVMPLNKVFQVSILMPDVLGITARTTFSEWNVKLLPTDMFITDVCQLALRYLMLAHTTPMGFDVIGHRCGPSVALQVLARPQGIPYKRSAFEGLLDTLEKQKFAWPFEKRSTINLLTAAHTAVSTRGTQSFCRDLLPVMLVYLNDYI